MKILSADKRIVVKENGPYHVSSGIPLSIREIVVNEEGESWDWKEGKVFTIESEYDLCRCGRSKSMPFCDLSHLEKAFDGAETAKNTPFKKQAKKITGPTLILRDVENLCAFARFCHPGGKIWRLIKKTDDPVARALVIREANYCPAGRLVIHDKKTKKEIEEPLEPSIGLVEDVAFECSGPLWIRGGIPIESADGNLYETRNRVTLCRCGASNNKPFCDGSHAGIKFNDGLME